MNIKALNAFRAIVTEGSAAQAAQKLNTSQPAISRLIAILERELKLNLFHRTRRRLVLTTEGSEFYKETEKILFNLSQIPRIADEIRRQNYRSISVVVMPRAISGWVAPATAQFMADHPDIRLSVDERRLYDLEQWVAGRHYDIGVGVLPANHPEIETRTIFRARAEVLMPADHALSKRDEISAADLKSETLIGHWPGLLPREQMDDVFNSAGIEPKYVMETSSYQLACSLVGQGAGLTICDRITAASAPGPNTVTRPLTPAKWMHFGVLLPKGAPQNDVVDELITYLRGDIERREELGRLEAVDP